MKPGSVYLRLPRQDKQTQFILHYPRLTGNSYPIGSEGLARSFYQFLQTLVVGNGFKTSPGTGQLEP